MSFGATETGDDDRSTAFTPKKSNLSRLAAERNAERKAAGTSTPSYSKDYLNELKSATPSRPVRTSGDELDDGEDDVQAVTRGTGEIDIASKFGPLATTSASSAIPTDAEIREKKERRARMAKEPNFLSLNSDEEDDDDDRLVLREKQKYPETRLDHDDEDVAEGFDEFTEDGKIALGRNAEREAARRRKREMAEMIARAEVEDDDAEEDDSEAERNAVYEAAQTRAGTYGERNTGHKTKDDMDRPRTPPRVAPVPELYSVMAKLKSALSSMEEVKRAKEIRLDELKAEKQDLGEREKWIQSQLQETGERYEKLRQEAGLAVDGTGGASMLGNVTPEGKLFLDRGLESLGARGATPVGGLDS